MMDSGRVRGIWATAGYLTAAALFCVMSLAAEEENGRQELAVFVGGVHNSENEDAFSVGLEYEYRLNEAWGIGGIVDYADLDPGETVAAVPLYFHITEAWKVFAAPGVSHTSDDDEFLVRLGTAYSFEFSRLSVSPALNIDLLDGEEVFVYGVNLGCKF